MGGGEGGGVEVEEGTFSNHLEPVFYFVVAAYFNFTEDQYFDDGGY